MKQGKNFSIGRVIFALFFLVFMVGCYIMTLGYSKSAKLFPQLALVLGMIMAAWNLFMVITGKDRRNTSHINETEPVDAETSGDKAESEDKPGEPEKEKGTGDINLRKMLILVAFFISMPLLTWLLGMPYAMPLCVFFYIRFIGKQKWLPAILQGIAVWVIVYWGFGVFLRANLDPGVLVSMIFG
jgi:hypothetical protein